MSNLRRYNLPDYSYFVTNVTFERGPVLVDNADLFTAALDSVGSKVKFDVAAWVLIPDHFHMIVNPGDCDLSGLMQRIKQSFSMNYRKRHSLGGRIWQLRFWDHLIRNDVDLARHVDYIHYNRVKHGHAHSPREYKHSSFPEYLRNGHYGTDWGSVEPVDMPKEVGE
jgi:putative transposase